MSYLNDPATARLATDCAICARPLRDAKSVECGVGPDCRKKHGFNADVTEEARAEGNRIIHAIAVAQLASADDINRVRALGFDVLAGKLGEVYSAVELADVDGRIVLTCGYDPDVVDALRAIPGRRYDRDTKTSSFPLAARPALWALVQRFWGGYMGVGPKGCFEIPGERRVRVAA